jgi:hypothetical protein
MLEPAQVPLASFIGGDYFDEWQFLGADGSPYDFTGWSGFSLTIGNEILTEGSGLTINHSAGTISPLLSRTTTATLQPGKVYYALGGIDPAHHLGYLMRGQFSWIAPLGLS